MAFDELWEQTHQTRIWGQYPNEQFTFFMQRFGLTDREARKNFQLLDIGCGQGANTWLQARDGYAVTALDASRSALIRLSGRLKEDNLGASLVRADFHEPLPFPDNGFDAVADVHSICYGTKEQVAATIREVHRILKPGGRFFCEMPKSGCPNEPFAQHGECHFATHADICEFFHGFYGYGCMFTARTDMHRNDSQRPFLEWWTIEARKRWTVEARKVSSQLVSEQEAIADSAAGLQLFTGDGELKPPIKFNIIDPVASETGDRQPQTADIVRNMRHAAGLGLPVLKLRPQRPGSAIIVAAGPSISSQLPKIRDLASDPANAVFAINWAHTWLINNGIIPDGCLLFEVDAEPVALMQTLHEAVTYYICSHCNISTFTALEGRKVVLWHNDSKDPEIRSVLGKCFRDQLCLGGSYVTFLRTISLALVLGYRDFDVFGVDSSYPVDSTSTHVEGYPAGVTDRVDGIDIFAKNPHDGEVRAFRSVPYLARQVEEFHNYCAVNHSMFRMRLHGDGLLQWEHRVTHPGEYSERA